MVGDIPRIGEELRESGETKVKVKINLDVSGKYNFRISGDVDLREPAPMFYFNHFLENMILWGLQDLDGYLEITDMSFHHGYEDVSIALGRAYRKSFGDKKGIRRSASGILPFEDSRAEVAIDLSGRGHNNVETEIPDPNLKEMVNHVVMTLAREGGIDIYARTYGMNGHHQGEALFKQLGRNIYDATRGLEGLTRVLSSKKMLE